MRLQISTVDAKVSKIISKHFRITHRKGSFNRDFSQIKSWIGGVVASPWISGVRLFEVACKRNPELKNRLRDRVSKRPGATKSTKTPQEKFIYNITVIQRTGGVTPGAWPLMQSKFAIDSRFVCVKGKPQIEFRIAIGRSEPEVCGLRDYNAAQATKAVAKTRTRSKSKSKSKAA